MERMGSKEIMLLLMICFQFCYPASCLPSAKNLTSARLQEKAGEKETDGYNTSSRDGKTIANRSNYAAGGRGGSSGGGSSGRGSGGSRPGGGGERENGGGSTPKSGAGVIPLYAAGAGHGHHNNHNGAAASCNRIASLWEVILASLVVHVYVVLGSEKLV